MASTAVLGTPRLVGRPVIWDRDEGRTGSPASPRIRERAARLSRGLIATGVAPGRSVVILCCSDHAEDRAVGVAAVEMVGGVPVIPVDWSRRSQSAIFADQGPRAIHLACEEGVEAWRAARGTGVMIGDGMGVLWWRALECRHA